MPQMSNARRREALRPTVDKRTADYADATAAQHADEVLQTTLRRITALDRELTTLETIINTALERLVVIEKTVQVLMDKEVERERRPERAPSRAELVNRQRLAAREQWFEDQPEPQDLDQ